MRQKSTQVLDFLKYAGVLLPLLLAMMSEEMLVAVNSTSLMQGISDVFPVVDRFAKGSVNDNYGSAVAAVQCMLFLLYIGLLLRFAPFWSAQKSLAFVGAVVRNKKGERYYGGIAVIAIAFVMVASDVFGLPIFSIYRWEMFGGIPNTPISDLIFRSKIVISLFSWWVCLFQAAAYYFVAITVAGIVNLLRGDRKEI